MKLHEALACMLENPGRRFYHPGWQCSGARLGAPNGTVQIRFQARSVPAQDKWQAWTPYASDISADYIEAAAESAPKKTVIMAPALVKYYDAHECTYEFHISDHIYETEVAARKDVGDVFVRWLIQTHAVEVEVVV